MSNVLTVPHYPQLADGYCLPACVQMVLAYWGIESEQDSLARQLGLIERAGIPGSRLLQLASPGLEVTYQSGTISDLQNALVDQVPPIILLITGELPYWSETFAHAVVLAGMDNEKVILNDPAINQPSIYAPLDDFHLAWDEMMNLYALLKKV